MAGFCPAGSSHSDGEIDMTVCVQDELRDSVALITLRRPEVLNAINDEMVACLEDALDRHETSDAIALVITGEGRAFCAGSDLKEVSVDRERRVQRMHTLAKRLIDYPKVSIAAINGLAFGGGLELAMACTFRIAAPDATLALPEVKLSLMPGYGGTQLLTRLVGPARALEVMLFGDAIPADRAREMGLLTAVEDDVIVAAIALAQRCAEHGQPVQLALRRAVSEGYALPIESAFKLERLLGRSLASTPEAMAALAKFARKRLPNSESD